MGQKEENQHRDHAGKSSQDHIFLAHKGHGALADQTRDAFNGLVVVFLFLDPDGQVNGKNEREDDGQDTDGVDQAQRHVHGEPSL
ncbi:hypothetical protein SDC9_157647 [bioreactor metagenome]|uniref:Uncharacterized protein n=1 Tax=bioreactor metagenome TaxID=1076179 RepID=A0A645F9W3_9ZZZZ